MTLITHYSQSAIMAQTQLTTTEVKRSKYRVLNACFPQPHSTNTYVAALRQWKASHRNGW